MTDRYKHQIACSQIGSGQEVLRVSDVAIIGCGGLGSNIAVSLARMGIGELRLFDSDRVSFSNLHRQHFTEIEASEAQFKASALAHYVRSINGDVDVESHCYAIDLSNIRQGLEGVDVVVDATNNLESRLLINDFCYAENIPWVYGGVNGVQGMVMTFIPRLVRCFRCLFPDAADKSENGILPPLVKIVAEYQSVQVLKLLLNCDNDPLLGKLLSINAWTGRTTVVNVDNCPHCHKA